MRRYAGSTDVSVERSRAEVESTLTRYGATHFAYAMQPGLSTIAFQAHGRRIRFDLPMPDRSEHRFTHWRLGRSSSDTPRPADKIHAAWEQACRQSWRALALVVKAKLEAVEAKITTFEDEFMAHIVMPDGITVGDHIRTGIASAYATGKMPPLLPPPSRDSANV